MAQTKKTAIHYTSFPLFVKELLVAWAGEADPERIFIQVAAAKKSLEEVDSCRPVCLGIHRTISSIGGRANFIVIIFEVGFFVIFALQIVLS